MLDTGLSTLSPTLVKPREIAIAASSIGLVVPTGREQLQVLKDVSLEIRSGDVQLLMGPSGSGKTTLLSILAGIMTPTAGSVKLLGQEITTLSRPELARFRLDHIGFVFQDFNLFPALTTAENIEVALNIRGIWGRQARKQSLHLLDQVDLSHKANALPRDLSGGQKQRVAIARALAGHPQLIMADEPTASLDSQSGHRIMEILCRLAQEDNCTVLIVTHDPRIVDFADCILHMEDGVIKDRGCQGDR